MDITSFVIVLVIVVCVLLVLTCSSKNEEGYYLRDLPYGWGFGGYPKGLHYPKLYTPKVDYGFYGAPDLYPGYDPGMGLTW